MKNDQLKVRLSNDVYRTCLVHALSTEREEVMGLLIGEVLDVVDDVTDDDYVFDDKSGKVLEVVALKIMERSDKRKDRVEIRSAQL